MVVGTVHANAFAEALKPCVILRITIPPFMRARFTVEVEIEPVLVQTNVMEVPKRSIVPRTAG